MAVVGAPPSPFLHVDRRRGLPVLVGFGASSYVNIHAYVLVSPELYRLGVSVSVAGCAAP